MSCIDYLHSRDIFYGDMKPENLLIFRDLKVKIGDFGISVKVNEKNKDKKLFKIKGFTPGYVTAEIENAF